MDFIFFAFGLSILTLFLAQVIVYLLVVPRAWVYASKLEAF
jgi:hypothetical protein